MVTDMFQIPRLERTVEGGVVVTRWGRVGGHLLRAGDRLVLGTTRTDELLVLMPRGYGRPMLGRRAQGGLIAEPTGVPASGLRWEVGGSVVAVERDHERGGVGAGDSYVVCRVEGNDIASLAQARAIFMDGPRTERELIHLCSLAAVAPETMGVHVAIAAADVAERAESLLEDVQAGRIRYAMPEFEPEDVHQGMVLPGPWQTHTDVQIDEVSPRTRSVLASEPDDDDMQLPLFGRQVIAS